MNNANCGLSESTANTLRMGLADHLTEYATGFLVSAARLRGNPTSMPLSAELQALNLMLGDFTSKLAEFKRSLNI